MAGNGVVYVEASVLCADPPWAFGDRLPGKARGAGRNYAVLSVRDLCRFPLPEMEKNAWLFLWRVSAMQEESLQVCRLWGFTPKSEIVWEKLTKTGKPWFGMGRYVRASHETCLIAVRGRPKPLVRTIRSRFAAPVPLDPDGRYLHSAKPECFYTDIVERIAPGPYVELFARRRRPGWASLGNQLPPQEEAA